MSIFLQIKSDMLKARKDGDKNKLLKLSTLVGELQKKESSIRSELDDSITIKIINQFINGIDENIKFMEGNDVSSLKEERDIYSTYLPRELTTEEIEKIIIDSLYPNGAMKYDAKIGQLMEILKKYSMDNNVIYNGKIASQIAKRELDIISEASR